jgi:enamine deaminase RidA (YjgF/YER057c/UK114 family)
MSGLINLKCPFHSFMLGAVATIAAAALSSYIARVSKEPKVKRFGIEGRFTNSAAYQGLVFTSGQIGEGGNIKEQTADALREVDKALQEAGSDKSRVIEVTVWLADIQRDYAGMNEVYDSWIVRDAPPTRACVEAKLFSPKYLVEIRVVAAL